MVLMVPPECRSLTLDATEYLKRTENETVSQSFAAGAAAVVAEAELVLERFER